MARFEMTTATLDPGTNFPGPLNVPIIPVSPEEQSILNSIKAKNQEIDKQLALVKSLRNKAALREQEAIKTQAWLNGRPPCRGTKENRASCIEQNARATADVQKFTKWALEDRASAKHIEDVVIPALREDLASREESLTNYRITANEVSIELANQGLTSEAVYSRETEFGKGLGDSERFTGAAEAGVITKKGDASTQNLKIVGYILAGLAVVGAYFFISYLSKKSKNK